MRVTNDRRKVFSQLDALSFFLFILNLYFQVLMHKALLFAMRFIYLFIKHKQVLIEQFLGKILFRISNEFFTQYKNVASFATLDITGYSDNLQRNYFPS
mmetsp:Transcript_12532/g.16225  ORF Transcript_12532/g.16225 Transcript_12532/m.16225 type:complete len:99 (-) Transcript_12532:109-405(-)